MLRLILIFIISISCFASQNFDTGDYITAPDSSDWDIVASNSTDWTISLWVRPNSYPALQTPFVSQGNTVNGWTFEYRSGHTDIEFRVKSGSAGIITITGGSLTINTWQHIALVKNGSIYGIYQNGSQIAYLSDSSTVNVSGTLLIGTYNGNYFDGQMSNIIISNSNLFGASPNSGSTDTFSLLWNSSMKRMPLQYDLTNLKLFLPLDDYETGTNTNSLTFKDLSNNNHVATATGGDAIAEQFLSYPPN